MVLLEQAEEENQGGASPELTPVHLADGS